MEIKDFTLILEAGVNHNGDLDNALKLVSDAAETGADYIKFQTYKADRLAAKNSPSYWDLSKEPTASQNELFSKYDSLTSNDYFKLAKEANRLGIGFITTCFDNYWVDELDSIIPVYKIASADITNFSLLYKIATKNKPVILSTGASTLDEIQAAISVIREKSSSKISLLHCVLNYPTSAENACLDRIKVLARRFEGFEIGYSDHTNPTDSMQAIQIAYDLGARIFEKHFTLDKTSLGNDHYHSFDKIEAKVLIENLTKTRLMSNFDEDDFIEIQSQARNFARRGIYASKTLQAGHILSELDIIPLRPTTGPQGYSADQSRSLIGLMLNVGITAGDPILKSHLSQ